MAVRPEPYSRGMGEASERCPRCGATMDWRHQTWQCPRCLFKIGCCEGDAPEVGEPGASDCGGYGALLQSQLQPYSP